MLNSAHVNNGKEYLSGVPMPKLGDLYRHERPGKSRERLQAAALRKLGKTIKEISSILGRGVGTIHRWLCKIEHEGLEGRYDSKSPGRPRLLNREEERLIGKDLDGTPHESGFERGSWVSKMIVQRIRDRFDIPYSRRSAIRLAHRLGFSFRKPRPIPYNCATPEEQEKFIRNGRAAATRWRAEGRTVLAIDAATIRDSPMSRRGFRRKGGRDTVSTNYSKKSIHMVGGLGADVLELKFCDTLSAGSYIALLEHLRRRYGKVGVISDNASALTGKEMRKYLADTNGDVEILHLPPRTPQLNPIEIEWREIKTAIADIFFGDLDKMRDVIRQMTRNGEIPIVKMFDWMLPAP